MKRRDFLLHVVAGLPTLLALGPITVLTQEAKTPGLPDKPDPSILSYQLGTINLEDIRTIFSALKQYRIEKSHLYLERTITRRWAMTMDAVTESMIERSGGLNLRFLSGKGWVGLSEGRFSSKEFKDNLDKLLLQYFQFAQKKNLAAQKPVPGKIPTGDSTAVLKDSLVKVTETPADTVIFKEIKEYRDDLNRVPPSLVTQNDVLNFLEQFKSFKTQVIPEISGVTFRWRDYEKMMSSWLDNGEFSQDTLYTAGWEVECRVGSEIYSYRTGGSQNLKTEIMAIKGSEIEGVFQKLRERIDEDTKLEYDTPVPNLYPILLDPGQNAVLWGSCLYPYFDCAFPFKDNPIRKNIQFPAEFSLVDNPRLKSSRANLLVDDDGYPCKELYLIQNGKPSSILIGRVESWMKVDGVTGRSRRAGFDADPIIAPTNLIVPAGGDKPEDLLTAYSKMVWIEKLGRVVCDYSTGNFSAVIEKGYWVENGQRSKKLKNLILTDNIFEFCKKIKGIGKDLKVDNSDGYYYNGGNPVVVSYGMPTMLFTESLVTHFKRS